MTGEELFDKFFPDGKAHYGIWYFCPLCKEIFHEMHICSVYGDLIIPGLKIGPQEIFSSSNDKNNK